MGKLTDGVVSVALVDPDANVRIDLSKNMVFFRNKRDGVETSLDAIMPGVLPPPRGFWDRTVPWLMPLESRAISDGDRVGVMLAVLSRSSLLLSRLFGSLGQIGFAILIVTGLIAGTFLLMELAATWPTARPFVRAIS